MSRGSQTFNDESEKSDPAKVSRRYPFSIGRSTSGLFARTCLHTLRRAQAAYEFTPIV